MKGMNNFTFSDVTIFTDNHSFRKVTAIVYIGKTFDQQARKSFKYPLPHETFPRFAKNFAFTRRMVHAVTVDSRDNENEKILKICKRSQ